MKIVYIALLLLGLVSCGVQKSPARLSDTKTVLAEMDKDQFGSTIISTVALNAATGNPVEEIILLLNQIIEDLETEQEAADEKNRTDQAVCDETINDYTKQIATGKQNIIDAENRIEINEKILSSAKVSLAQADKDFEEVVESIETGTAEREAQHSRWVEEDYQNQISIATLEEGVKLINHMIHGVAFSQIKSRYDKVLENLKDNNNKHSSMFKPIISSLTQLATKLNYENVMKILDLLNNIRQSIVEERENARIEEEQAQADWEKLLKHLTSEKQRLADKRAKLRNLIASTEKLLIETKKSLENFKEKLESDQMSLESTVSRCDAQSEIYTTETGERTRELGILNKLVEHIQEKYAQVKDYVAQRGSPDF